jgi:hypothetical protein
MGVGRGKCGVPRRRDARRMGFGSFTSQALRETFSLKLWLSFCVATYGNVPSVAHIADNYMTC